MTVLGYGGLGAGLGYELRVLPGADPRTLRMRQGLDPAAAQIDDDGRTVASAQERHDGPGRGPLSARLLTAVGAPTGMSTALSPGRDQAGA